MGEQIPILDVNEQFDGIARTNSDTFQLPFGAEQMIEIAYDGTQINASQVGTSNTYSNNVIDDVDGEGD
jgi:hypothetical protein